MIIKIIQRHKATTSDGESIVVQANMPVQFVDFAPGDMAIVELPDGRKIHIRADCVGGFEPELSLAELAEETGIEHATLRRAANEGRLLARKAGRDWLSIRTAVEYAVREGKLRN